MHPFTHLSHFLKPATLRPDTHVYVTQKRLDSLRPRHTHPSKTHSRSCHRIYENSIRIFRPVTCFYRRMASSNNQMVIRFMQFLCNSMFFFCIFLNFSFKPNKSSIFIWSQIFSVDWKQECHVRVYMWLHLCVFHRRVLITFFFSHSNFPFICSYVLYLWNERTYCLSTTFRSYFVDVLMWMQSS